MTSRGAISGRGARHEHPERGRTILVRPPVTFSEWAAGIRRRTPRFGERGEEVARELGYHEVAIADRRASGALIPPS
jgi:crotonobetainyl-CoA:carnitine CoA-transferase CaiB-like acyl-CoA transferase